MIPPCPASRSYVVAALVSAGATLMSGEGMAQEDLTSLWNAVLALDAGPKQIPTTPDEAKTIYSRHVEFQERSLRRFLSAAGNDSRVFEARLRLARALTIRAELEGRAEFQNESSALLDSLESQGSREQKAEVAFTRISQWMRRNRFPDASQRAELLAAVREFRESFPADRRLARLLVEVATRFDREPTVKAELLGAAARMNEDPGLRKRIADDQTRLDLLGKTLPLRFQDLNGRPFRMEDCRGKRVVVLYFAESSSPSLEAWKRVNEVLRAHPEVVRVGISLDEDRVAMERARKVFGERWIIGWDGRGWMSSLARRWGVNTLPTVWLVNSSGQCVSLDALPDLNEQLQRNESSEPSASAPR